MAKGWIGIKRPLRHSTQKNPKGIQLTFCMGPTSHVHYGQSAVAMAAKFKAYFECVIAGQALKCQIKQQKFCIAIHTLHNNNAFWLELSNAFDCVSQKQNILLNTNRHKQQKNNRGVVWV
jgi:hypothetical protein